MQLLEGTVVGTALAATAVEFEEEIKDTAEKYATIGVMALALTNTELTKRLIDEFLIPNDTGGDQTIDLGPNHTGGDQITENAPIILTTPLAELLGTDTITIPTDPVAGNSTSLPIADNLGFDLVYSENSDGEDGIDVDDFMVDNTDRLNQKLGTKIGQGRLPFETGKEGFEEAKQTVEDTLSTASSISEPFINSNADIVFDIYSEETGFTVRVREDGTFDTLIDDKTNKF